LYCFNIPMNSSADTSFDVIDFLKKNPRTKLQPFKYDAKKKEWVQKDYSSSKDTPLNEIKFVTYNVWFGTRSESEQELTPRLSGLFSLIKGTDADVICLQEVTKPIVAILMKQDFIRDSYWLSDSDQGGTYMRAGYGILICSKLPYKNLLFQTLPTKLGRSALTAEFRVNQESLSVTTCHFESYPVDVIPRQKQLKVISQIVSDYDHSVLMGDFNFASETERKETIGQSIFTDMWPVLNGNELGYTFDFEDNKMLGSFGHAALTRGRIDLIVYRSKGDKLRPTAVQRLGTEPLQMEPKIIYPSDHFGVYGVLSIKN